MAGAEIIGDEEFQNIKKLFSRDKVNLYRYGPENYLVTELENNFAEYLGVKYAHAVSSGTAAIHCALAGVGISKGDEVITTAFTFVAPIEAISALGAVPVPVNIDNTFSLDPEEIKKNISNKTKAIVCVPMWAAPKMDEIVKICKENDLILIEDAAQSLGGYYKSKKIGTFGQVGSFSFDFGKTLHTGEGGIVVTDEKDIYDKIAEFSDHGHMHKLNLPRGLDPRRKKGLNYRMSELTAAVGIAQLNKIDFILKKAKENKKLIKDGMKNTGNIKFREYTDEQGAQGDTIIFSFETSQEAKSFEKSIVNDGFGTKILPEAIEWHYAGAWNHILKEYEYYENIDLENHFKSTGELLRRSICLNVPITISKHDIERLIVSINNALQKINFTE